MNTAVPENFYTRSEEILASMSFANNLLFVLKMAVYDGEITHVMIADCLQGISEYLEVQMERLDKLSMEVRP